MIRSTYTKALTTIAVVAGAMTILVPVAHAASDPNRVADSVDAARAAQQRTESLSLQSGYGVNRVADSVDAARAAQLRDASGLTDLASSYRLLRSLESVAAPTVESQLERPQPIDGGGFHWSAFSIGAATGVGLMLLLGGLGAGVARRGRGQVRTA